MTNYLFCTYRASYQINQIHPYLRGLKFQPSSRIYEIPNLGMSAERRSDKRRRAKT